MNIDNRPGPGVDLIADLDTERPLSGFANSSVDEIRAHSILEHLLHWERLVLDCARVLKSAGRLDVRVPHGHSLYPYHVRFFHPYTLDPFRSDYIPRGLDLLRRPARWGSFEFSDAQYFVLEEQYLEHAYPFAWHLAKYALGDSAYRIPLGKGTNIRFILLRNTRRYVDEVHAPEP